MKVEIVEVDEASNRCEVLFLQARCSAACICSGSGNVAGVKNGVVSSNMPNSCKFLQCNIAPGSSFLQGDIADLHVSSSGLGLATLIVFLLPVLGLVAGVGVGSLYSYSEGLIYVSSILGMLLGISITAIISGRIDWSQRFNLRLHLPETKEP
ncbi:MAG: SoxR reducing system RseC family protein [Pseudomonadales bacterium]|nr:SoxR reducing system RseC family protein [Pseudomonadales bacterium]